MYYCTQTKIFDTIFKLFPDAYIVSKSELKPIKQIESSANVNPELDTLAKPQRSVSRACKRKGFDSHQLSLFDEIEGGGI